MLSAESIDLVKNLLKHDSNQRLILNMFLRTLMGIRSTHGKMKSKYRILKHLRMSLSVQ